MANQIVVRGFYLGYSALERASRFLRATYAGVGLGALSQNQVHRIGERRFRQDSIYWTDEWNRSGLFDWEARAIDRFFPEGSRILVAAAGGGREMLALRRRGFHVIGFEADPGLRDVANRLMQQEDLSSDIGAAEWDHAPELPDRFDALIIGWSAYMHIRGRQNRVTFLRELRRHSESDAPLLLSFYTRSNHVAFLEAVARTGNFVGKWFGRSRVEVGDTLSPNFIHYFTREQLQSELEEGGFDLLLYETLGYGHAVAKAR